MPIRRRQSPPRRPARWARWAPARAIRVIFPDPRRPRRPLNAGLVLVSGFAGLIGVGTLLLMLPLASAAGTWTPALDALFTATSAVCVTGLVVVDTGTHWSGLGQGVLAVLMQVGGLGFMTFSTLLLRLIGRRASLRDRLLLNESLGGGTIGSATTLARRVLLFTLVAEGVGTVVLTLAFRAEHPWPVAAWWGVFHTISAFNNASLDITGGFRGLTPYQSSPVVLVTIAALIVLGGLSYGVVEDIWHRRDLRRLALDSKVVLVTTAALLGGGTLALLFTERSNPATLGALPWDLRVLNAFFHAVAARTAGFNTIDIAALTEASLLTLIGLMLIGGSTGSVAGGIKLQTFAVLIGATISAVRGLPDVLMYGRRVPMPDVLRAIAVTVISLALVFLGSFALSLTEEKPFLRELFEIVSAYATVGFSTGLTLEATTSGRLVLIGMMFAGRLGPLTLALALAEREHRLPYRWPAEPLRIG